MTTPLISTIRPVFVRDDSDMVLLDASEGGRERPAGASLAQAGRAKAHYCCAFGWMIETWMPLPARPANALFMLSQLSNERPCSDASVSRFPKPGSRD